MSDNLVFMFINNRVSEIILVCQVNYLWLTVTSVHVINQNNSVNISNPKFLMYFKNTLFQHYLPAYSNYMKYRAPVKETQYMAMFLACNMKTRPVERFPSLYNMLIHDNIQFCHSTKCSSFSEVWP